MTSPRLHHLQALSPGGLHRIAYREWGAADNPRVVVCVHGLTRQSCDFDALARRLAPEFRVICPDVVGRGDSGWLANPLHYGIPQYVADMVSLVARLDVEQVDWVGTSMGGLIGLGLAALPGSPVRRLVLNDVGPSLEWQALQRIGAYLGQAMVFDSVEEGAAQLRSISQGFGTFSEAEWLALSRPMFRASEQGVRLHYDPAIGQAFRALTPELAAAGEAQLWAAWAALSQPVLVLRGAQSDLLSAETAARMIQTGAQAQLLTLPEVGHAPMLDRAEQQDPVIEFLRQP
ncbi:pimeloyl-ACP methyl ester carboxylesterase [Inhella inkyongensis]|uniref:Pimeloyl-ACP methyl ester carboxylesterase n=1 Tax=Inhella inkyongensis TaxID=392593 RepID=A0A840S8Y6_9BURK|nr:alpha/beta hydrolase [Inhella inkyongensis]MBB5205988.1 pimeloyl-ACP methyl ester carboxylesterase [Inhella inkyongensis]